VAELPGRAGRAAEDASAEHDAAADPGADGEHDQVVRHQPQLLVMGFGERRDGGVVVDEHGYVEAIAERCAQRHVLERDVDRGDDAPGRELDDRGHTDAHPGEVLAGD
jgi:hypothetical protein